MTALPVIPAEHQSQGEASAGQSDGRPEAAGPLLRARALLLGERLDLRALESSERLAVNPLTIEVGVHGRAVLFRFGAVVLFGVDPLDELRLIDQLGPLIRGPVHKPEQETLDIQLDTQSPDYFRRGELFVRDFETRRLQVIADILAKSIVLAHYEGRIAAAFDRIEPLAEHMQREGKTTPSTRELIKHIGTALLSMQRMVGRAEILEKPEILWEHPELELLFLRLEDEYELKEREHALERKLDLIARTAETLLEMEQTKRGLRVEWYITILIVIEIGLTLYEMFIKGLH